jgi:hypothetical protein
MASAQDRRQLRRGLGGVLHEERVGEDRDRVLGHRQLDATAIKDGAAVSCDL